MNYNKGWIYLELAYDLPNIDSKKVKIDKEMERLIKHKNTMGRKKKSFYSTVNTYKFFDYGNFIR